MRILTKGLFGAALVALALSVSACGSSGGGGGGGSGASGVTSSKKLVDLTNAEKGKVCDWMVARAGSYGDPGTCDAVPTAFLAYFDQAECIADSPDATFTDCQATVAELEACVSKLSSCATLIQAASEPACADLTDC